MADTNQNQGSVSPGSTGATLVVGQIVMANMTFYVVDETKLDSLSARNDESKTFYSISAGLFFLGVGFWTNQFFTDKLSDKGWLVAWIAGPICIVIAGAFVFLGHRFSKRGKTMLNEIKKNKAVTSVELQVSTKATP